MAPNIPKELEDAFIKVSFEDEGVSPDPGVQDPAYTPWFDHGK